MIHFNEIVSTSVTTHDSAKRDRGGKDVGMTWPDCPFSIDLNVTYVLYLNFIWLYIYEGLEIGSHMT